jgi:hypothetical protein
LLLFTWLAESSWVYLACLLGGTTAGILFSPAAVLFPYGASVVVALLLQRWVLSRHSALSARGAVAITTLQLSAGLLSLLATMWWELYRGEPLFNLGWIRAAATDARNPLGSGLPTPAWLAILVFSLWWRGSRLAREQLNFRPLVSRFLWATALLLGISAMAGQLLESPSAEGWLAAYLLSALASLAAARLETTSRERQGGVDSGWQWRGPLIALLLLAGGSGIAFFLFPALAAAAHGLQQLLVDVILPAALELLKWIIHLLGLDQPPQPLPATPEAGSALQGGRMEPPPSLPDWLRAAARRLFDLSWISLLLYALYLWVKRWRLDDRRRAEDGATREKMPWDWKLSLRWLLRRLLARWPRLLRRIGLAASPSREPAGTVREVYRKLQRWGEKQGYPRPSWTTPSEYCAALSAAWPALEASFSTITESYLRARYGELPATPDELSAALAGWQRIAEQKSAPNQR